MGLFKFNINFLLPLIFLGVLFENASAQTDHVSLQLKWWHQFQFAGYYAADIKGYYKDEKINVRIMPRDTGDAVLKKVEEGKADFGITDGDIIIDHANGKKVVVIANVFQHAADIVISPQKNHIITPTDLLGKRLMTVDNQGWVEIKAMLLKEGVKPDSVKILKHTFKYQDLENGYADAMTSYSSDEIETSKVNKIEPVNYGIDFYGDLLFTMQSNIDKNPALVERFKRASMKGWDYAMAHPEEMADYILTLPGVKERGLNKQKLLWEAEAMKKLILPDLVEIGHINNERWQHILDIYKSLGLVNKNVTLKNFIYDAEQNTQAYFFKRILKAAVVAALFFALVLLYSLVLRRAVKKRTIDLQKEILNREKAQDQLQISEERLALAVEAAELGIWDWEISSNTFYFNDYLLTMLGYKAGEISMTLNNYLELLNPDDKEVMNKHLDESVQGKLEHFEVIIRLKTKENKWKWILCVYKVINSEEDGSAVRLTGIHLDINKIKEKEVELNKLSQDLLNKNNELQQFAYITSHNLRAPVANMLSLLNLINRPELSEKNALYLDKVDFSVNNLKNTLNDVNEILFARAEEIDNHKEIIFEEVLKECLASIEQQVVPSNTSVRYDFQIPSVVYSPKILESIFLNLITNSIKFKKIDTDPVIWIKTEQSGADIILTIGDNGRGIDLDKYRNKVFQLYERFHADTPGKGLGLYIIKSQVTSMHGEIAVESAPGEGTKFTIVIKNFEE